MVAVTEVCAPAAREPPVWERLIQAGAVADQEMALLLSLFVIPAAYVLMRKPR